MKTKWWAVSSTYWGYCDFRDTNDLYVLETAAFSSLHSDFFAGFLDVRWKDVILIGTKGFKSVHSVILQARCSVLYSMLLEKYPGFSMTGSSYSIEIPTSSMSTLTLLCEYLYSDLSKEQFQRSAGTICYS